MTPYAGANRIRFYGTLSACTRRGQAPRSTAKSNRAPKDEYWDSRGRHVFDPLEYVRLACGLPFSWGIPMLEVV